jgi:hypothetical protein
MDALQLAENLKQGGRTWHFHFLDKDCKFNPQRGMFALIIEDETGNKKTEFFFAASPLETSQKLAQLLYGTGFLGAKPQRTGNNDFENLLALASKCKKEGKHWCYHHLVPSCVFNSHKGKYVIILEADGRILEAIYDSNSMGDLMELEKLFYSSK